MGWPISPRALALIVAALAGAESLDLEPSCAPDVVSFGSSGSASRLSPGEALSSCGLVLLRGAASPGVLQEALESFLQLSRQATEALRHGHVREQREQFHLPFVPPFDRIELLGTGGHLRQPLAAVLGVEFVLDMVVVVVVPPGAGAQELHRDAPLPGSVSAHMPLHALSEAAAPLGICAGTHTYGRDDERAIFREAQLWRPKNESYLDAERRLYCGGRPKTRVFHLSVPASDLARLIVRDSRLGASIVAFRPMAEPPEWQPGDEITHIDGQRVSGRSDFRKAAEARTQGLRDVRLERPLEGPPERPPRLLIGAPLAVGDVLLYDSRTKHWGMANTGNSTRFALYISFKNSEVHGGVHPEADIEANGTAQLRAARRGFQARLSRLRDAGGMEL